MLLERMKNPTLWLRIVLYLLVCSWLIIISWQAWADITVDFGREVYTPWRLSEGDVLYKDISYPYGPLSPYWNMFWFSLLGTTIHTIFIINVVLLIVLIFLLEDWLSFIGDRFSATVAVLFFLLVFAFGRYSFIGNYNYITPYSHALVHGLIITLALLASFRRWWQSRKKSWLIIAGVLLGLSILTQIEVSLAAISVALTYLIANLILKKEYLRSLRDYIYIFLPAFFAPIFSAVFLMWARMPLTEALSKIFSQYISIFNGSFVKITNLLFYKEMIGFNNLPGHFLSLIEWGLLYLAVLLIVFLLSKSLRYNKDIFFISFLAVSITFLAGRILFSSAVLYSIMYPFPVIMLVGTVASVIYLIKKRKQEKFSSDVGVLCLASFIMAGVLLIKIILKVDIHIYGFVLAMPATLLSIVVFVGILPKYFNSYGTGKYFKLLMLGLISVLGLSYTNISSSLYSSLTNFKVHAIYSGDTIRTDSVRGPVIEEALADLENRLRPGETFAVLPEGVTLNYLLRCKNPTPYINFMPLELLVYYKEDLVIDSFASNPPSFFVIVHKDTSEYGFNYFGIDYGVKLYDWVKGNYKLVRQIKDEPLKPGSGYGVAIYKHI